MRAFDSSAVGDVAGIELPVEAEVRDLVATLGAGVSMSAAIGEQHNVMKAAAALRERAAATPESVRAVAPTLGRALRATESGGHDATATALYMSGIRERRREHLAATLAEITDPTLVRGYEASTYSLQGLVAVVGETLTATTAAVVREHCLRTLAAVARTRPAVARAGLDADAVSVAVEWLHNRASVERWQAIGVAELLAVTVPADSSVCDEAPVTAVTEQLLEREAPTMRALAQVIQRRVSSGDTQIVDASEGESFAVLQQLDDHDSLVDRQCRDLIRAVGRCIALAPGLVGDAPAALVERVRMAPQADRAMAASALGIVVAHQIAGAGTLRAALVDYVHAAAGDSRRRRVRAVGEVAVACPDRMPWVPTEFQERVAAATVPAASAVRAVGECVVAATDANRTLAELRRRVRAGTGPGDERAAVAFGEWIAHDPDIVDASVDSLAAAVRATNGDERETKTTVLSTYAVIADEGVDIEAVVGQAKSTLGARVRGERVLAGHLDDRRVNPETWAQLRNTRGCFRRLATHALGVAVQYRDSAVEPPIVALSRAVASSPLEARPTRLRLLGEWVAATGAGERVGGVVGSALARRIRKTAGADRERAARALGLVTTTRQSDEALADAATAAGARIVIHDEVTAATRRAVGRARPEKTQASRTELPAGVPADSRDWPLRTLGELVAVAEHTGPFGCSSLATTVAESSGWDRRRAARALGVTVILDVCEWTGIRQWSTGSLASPPESRQALTYTLGEIAAAQPNWFSGVPDALVASVRDASGAVRTTTARALGEYVRYPTLDDPGSVHALQAAAADAEGDARDCLTRALGEILVAIPAVDVDVPALLIDAVAGATGQDRRALARLLGELAISGDPGDVLDRVAPTGEDASVFERARRSRMTEGLAAIDAVDLDEILAAVSITTPADGEPATTTSPDEPDFSVLLDAPAPIRDPLLEALTTALENRAASPASNLDGHLDAWLRDATDADPATRLHAVAARSAVDTTAASVDIT